MMVLVWTLVLGLFAAPAFADDIAVLGAVDTHGNAHTLVDADVALGSTGLLLFNRTILDTPGSGFSRTALSVPLVYGFGLAPGMGVAWSGLYPGLGASWVAPLPAPWFALLWINGLFGAGIAGGAEVSYSITPTLAVKGVGQMIGPADAAVFGLGVQYSWGTL